MLNVKNACGTCVAGRWMAEPTNQWNDYMHDIRRNIHDSITRMMTLRLNEWIGLHDEVAVTI